MANSCLKIPAPAPAYIALSRPRPRLSFYPGPGKEDVIPAPAKISIPVDPWIDWILQNFLNLHARATYNFWNFDCDAPRALHFQNGFCFGPPMRKIIPTPLVNSTAVE